VFVHSFPLEQQIPLLTLLWSCKEAMFKWWGMGDVDFSEVLRIFPFAFDREGKIDALFTRETLQVPLTLSYSINPQMSLVWVADAGESFYR
jgi:hypothetical protein